MHKMKMSMKLSVCASFVCGFLFRFINFDKAPLWIDEYGTWWVIAGMDLADLVERTLNIQGQSPFYYSLTYFSALIFGAAPYGLRFFSMIAGILIVPLGYFLVRRLGQSETTAMSTAWLLAANNYLIFQSQNARPYSLALFFGLLASYAFVRSLTSNKIFPHFVCMVANVATFYSHYLICGFWLAQISYLLISKTISKRAKVMSFLCAGAVCFYVCPPYRICQLLRAERKSSNGWTILHQSPVFCGIF